eukprot:6455290-Amphidinium_carterae.2
MCQLDADKVSPVLHDVRLLTYINCGNLILWCFVALLIQSNNNRELSVYRAPFGSASQSDTHTHLQLGFGFGPLSHLMTCWYSSHALGLDFTAIPNFPTTV